MVFIPVFEATGSQVLWSIPLQLIVIFGNRLHALYELILHQGQWFWMVGRSLWHVMDQDIFTPKKWLNGNSVIFLIHDPPTTAWFFLYYLFTLFFGNYFFIIFQNFLISLIKIVLKTHSLFLNFMILSHGFVLIWDDLLCTI